MAKEKDPRASNTQSENQKKLVAVVTNLRMTAHGIKELYDGIMGVVEVLETCISPVETKADQVTEKPIKQNEKAKPVSLEEVRSAAIQLSNNGGRDEIPELLKKYGATKLSGVKLEDLPSLLTDIEERNHES